MLADPAPSCGSPECPVPPPHDEIIANIATVEMSAGRTSWRGHLDRHRADELVPGLGDTRFAPIDDQHHAHLGATRTVAILESALHRASGPQPRIQLLELAGWTVSPVAPPNTINVADLRDDELARLNIIRNQIVSTGPSHYACTRRWAQAIRATGVSGVLWHSRQADLHAAANPAGLIADVLVHTPAEVAVIWGAPGDTPLLRAAGTAMPLLVDGRPSRLVVELSALIGAPIV